MTKRTLYLKRTLAAVSAAAMMLCFTACGSGGGESSAPEASATPEAVATPEPQLVTVKIATISNISGSLNIRSEPNTDCEVLAKAEAGDKFEVLTENCQQGWHEISYRGGKAYISSEYATITEEQRAAPTPTPDPNAPIIVNGSGREENSEEPSDEGMTPEGLEKTEDPGRR